MEMTPTVRVQLRKFMRRPDVDYMHPSQQAVRALASKAFAFSFDLTNIRNRPAMARTRIGILDSVREVYRGNNVGQEYPDTFERDEPQRAILEHLQDWAEAMSYENVDDVPPEIQASLATRQNTLESYGLMPELNILIAAKDILYDFAAELAAGPSELPIN